MRTSLSPEQQQKNQNAAAEILEGLAKKLRSGRISVLTFESQVEDDWVWSHEWGAPEKLDPRFFKFTIQVELMPEEDWEVLING